MHFLVRLCQLKAELAEGGGGRGRRGFLMRGDQVAVGGQDCFGHVQIPFKHPIRRPPHPARVCASSAGCDPGRPIKSSTLLTRVAPG